MAFMTRAEAEKRFSEYSDAGLLMELEEQAVVKARLADLVGTMSVPKGLAKGEELHDARTETEIVIMVLRNELLKRMKEGRVTA